MYYFKYSPKIKDTTFGNIHLFSDETNLLAVCFDKNLLKVKKTFSSTRLITKKSKVISKTIQQLEQYFKGKLKKFTVPIKIQGTEFQRKAWTGLLKIPYGKVIDYKTQCKMVNRPSAVRAIGSANGKNPFAIIIPCHRVVPIKFSKGVSNDCGGFAGGVSIKQDLLRIEGIVQLAGN